MEDGVIIMPARLEHAIARFAMTSKRNAPDVMKQQGKLLFADVALYTPPASEGVTGKAAEKQGRAKVAGDIRSLYGTPGNAYEAIAQKSPAQASAFWLLESAGQTTDAAQIVRDALGKSFSPFDAGILHERTNGGRSRRARRAREHVFYVNNPAELEAYIAKEQANVFWLASGWKDALAALGARLPYGVDKKNAPGSLRVSITNEMLEITMTNEVSFAREVRDIERRVLWAMNLRADKLDRQWEHYIKNTAREAGFKTS